MKKVIKWTLFSLILGGFVAYSLCLIIIPERTRVATDIVVDYLNKPLFIGCGCTVTVGLVLGIIIKYVLKATKINIKEDLEETKKFNAEVVVNAQKYYEQANQKEEEIKEICSHYEEEIVELDSPDKGLYIGPMVWREMFDFEDEAVLLVLASHEYDESDYIRNYEDYKIKALKYFESEENKWK